MKFGLKMNLLVIILKSQNLDQKWLYYKFLKLLILELK